VAESDDDVLRHTSDVSVRWRCFGPYRDTGWVKLAPLTILLGANSSGKSSFLAPLLLLKQSLLSRTGRNALLTRGDYIDAGVFEDFVHDHDKSGEVTLSIRWHSHAPDRKLSPVGSYEPGGAELTFKQGQDEQSVCLQQYKVEDLYRRTMLVRTLRPDGTYSLRMASMPPENRRKKSRTTKADAVTRRAMRVAMREAAPTDFLFMSDSVRQAGLLARMEIDDATFTIGIDDDRVRFYCAITDAVEFAIKSVLEDTYYVGPLREAPRRVYELSGEMPPDVGTRGEFAPEIVYRWRTRKPNIDEVQRWLARFGFGERLGFKAVGTGGFSLVMQRRGRPVASTLVDTGFGVSQVLPLVVQGLRADPSSRIIVEQPEIHLNPRLQAVVADLLASTVSRGIGLMVETHSEHVLLRLRTLVAAGDVPAGDVGIYFVERGEGEALVRRVPIEANGYINPNDWPKGFFEDSLREAMSLAQAQARAARAAEDAASNGGASNA
jgi:hypothetical protein